MMNDPHDSLFPETGSLPTPTANTTVPQPLGAPRLQRPERAQGEWRTDSLDQLLPHNDPARIVWQFVEGVDLAPLLQRIRAVQGGVGRSPIDPRILLALWLMATIDGYGSSRELEHLCQQHLRYQWICGHVSVNYHTLSDFRSAHPEFLNDVLTDSVASLLNQGLVELTELAQDGMRVRAHAGAGSFRRQASLEECLVQAKAQIDALASTNTDEAASEISARQRAARERAARERLERVEQALAERQRLLKEREEQKRTKGTKFKPDEVRGSTTDPEARTMKMPDKGTRPGFNLQFATDTESGVIVGVDATNSGSDARQLEPMLDQIKSRYDKTPDRILLDGGYLNLEAIQTASTEHGTEAYVPIKNEKAKLDQGEDPYAPRRTDTEPLKRWRARMGTAEGKEIYKRRAQTAEWVNAGMRQRGLYQVLLRGVQKVKTLGLWHAIAHNLLRSVVLGKNK